MTKWLLLSVFCLDVLVSIGGIGASVDAENDRRSKTKINFRHIMVPKIFYHAENRVLQT
jgi:hypothetical protein